jgi:hypothetical protein
MQSCVLDLFSDRRPVSVFAQARGRGEREVLKLAKHDYLHIVVLMEIIVKARIATFTVDKRSAPLRIARRSFHVSDATKIPTSMYGTINSSLVYMEIWRKRRGVRCVRTFVSRNHCDHGTRHAPSIVARQEFVKL